MATKTAPTRVRLKGLAGLVKGIQKQIQGGSYLKAEVARENASILLETVHKHLRELKAAPEQLTPASERAYRQLVALQEEAPHGRGQAPHGLRLARKSLPGIGALVAHFQANLGGAAPGSPQAARLGEEISRAARQIEALCQEKGLLPQDLVKDAGAAYAWLAFLARPGNLERHLAAVQRFNRAQQAPVRGRQAATVRATFYEQAAKFHWIRSPMGIRVQLHEGFIDSPEQVFQALAMLVRGTRSQKARALVNAYTTSPAYLALCRELMEIHEPAGGPGTDPRLVETFSRLNQQYFAGELPLPRLTWSSRAAYRVLGTYAPASDTITLSRIFRDGDLPAYLFEFVLFHEMLHKALGSQTSGSREMSHTAEFRRREQQHPQYQAAQDFIRTDLSLAGKAVSSRVRKKAPPAKRGRALF